MGQKKRAPSFWGRMITKKPPKTPPAKKASGNIDKLKKKIKDLEQLVQERTFEAKAISQQLINDIAGRKRVEEALRKSEDKYRSVLDNIGIGVSLISPEMEIIALNKQMRAWFPTINESKRPICYKSFNNPSRKTICTYCPTAKTLKDGLVHESITQTPFFDEIRNYRIVSTPLKDKEGKIIAAIEMVDDITEQKRAFDTILELNNSLVQFGPDPKKNIALLVKAAGLLLRGDCALYNRLQEDFLCTICDWNAPEDLQKKDKPRGHLCFDIISNADNTPQVVRNLQNSRYFRTDPNVKKFGLKTYIGHAVKLKNESIGSLCVVFTEDREFKPYELELLSILAKALSIEEEREMIKNSLSESEDRFNQITKISKEFIWDVNEKGLYTYASPAVENILGYKPEELVNKLHFYDIFPPEDKKRLMEEIFENIEKKVIFRRFVNKCLHKNGNIVILETNAVPIVNKNGGLLGYRGADTDITERNLQEESLKEAKEFAELLYRVIPSAIFTVDLDKKITNWNDKAAEITGYSLSDVLGKDCFMFAETPCRENCGLYDMDVEKPIMSRECVIIRKDGEKRVVIKNVDYLHDAKGKIIGGIESFEDITERKHAEERLKKAHDDLVQSEKLAALGRFSSSIAHEVKNPLGIIISGIEFLQRKMDKSDTETKTAILKVKEAALRASNTLEDLLKAARPSGLKIQKTSVSELIADPLSLLKYSLDAGGLKVKVDIEKNLYVEVDRSQLFQVLINIFVNSIEAMPNGGEINVRAYINKDELSLLGESQCVIEISDNGEGIPKDDLSKVFEPFYTTKTAKKGTGLGLPVAKMIIDKHKGSISIDSGPGKGTVVKIILPVPPA
ncbi:MAG: PAS domain S-box protein [Candidatus Omnitrophica bacterium]|nr:PAS domain S-box protein [Candidatus Omnitrophota bacterium]